jgi:hypothetical protein
MSMKQATTKLHASLRFFNAYHKLPVNAQGPVWDCVNKLMSNPAHPSLNYEAIKMASDPRLRSIRVNEQYRVIVAHPDGSGTYILLWVDKHDAAYGWAARHRLETGDEAAGLALVEYTERREEAPEQEPPTPQVPAGVTSAPPVEGNLHLYSDAQLVGAGVPEKLLPRLRACRSDADVERVMDDFPGQLAELILDLWTGEPRAVPVSEVPQAEPEPAGSVAVSDTLEIALRRPGSARHFVAISTEEDLKQALKYPLQLWRVFLHPEQRAIVRAHFDGPALVSGGAGTGKTVVGLHRARYLASEVFTAPTDRVLLTTFTYNLAQDLGELIESLCGDHPSIRQRIEVKHVHSLAKQIRNLAHEHFNAPEEGEDRQLMQEVVRQHNPLNLPAAFYLDEWNEVAQERDALTEEAYLQVDRAGRGRALTRRQRAEIWQVFEMYRRKMEASGKEEWPSVVRRARELIETGQVQFPYRYRAVIVDEAQDMGVQEMRLLLALVGQGPESLLLLGDTRQQVYKRGSYVHLLNIAIGRRHVQLRLNYRTTEQIRAAASSVLIGGTALTGEALGKDDSISLLRGPLPRVRRFASEEEEAAAVVAQVRETLSVMQPEEIVVVARTRPILKRYTDVLGAAGIPNTRIEKGPRGPGVQLATMHRVKGLEFRAVFIVNCAAGAVPQPKRGDVGDEAGRADHEERERRLLYVAMTRARELLWISGADTLSPFLHGVIV